MEIPVITEKHGENGSSEDGLCIKRLEMGPEGTCADRHLEDEWVESTAGKGRRTSLLGQTLMYVLQLSTDGESDHVCLGKIQELKLKVLSSSILEMIEE